MYVMNGSLYRIVNTIIITKFSAYLITWLVFGRHPPGKFSTTFLFIFFFFSLRIMQVSFSNLAIHVRPTRNFEGKELNMVSFPQRGKI